MKKSEVITVKIDIETKKRLEQEANKREWTISHTARKLIEKALNGTNTDPRREDSTL